MKMLVGNPLGHKYAGLVRDYGPRQEAVIIFMRPACSLAADKVAMPSRDACRPAYESLGRRLFPGNWERVSE